jgi:hypothetical protein
LTVLQEIELLEDQAGEQPWVHLQAYRAEIILEPEAQAPAVVVMSLQVAEVLVS